MYIRQHTFFDLKVLLSLVFVFLIFTWPITSFGQEQYLNEDIKSFENCKIQNYQRTHGFGLWMASIKRSDVKNCIMHVYWEVEGDWKKSFCIVPLTNVISSDWKTSFHPLQNFDKYCHTIVSGNVFTGINIVYLSPKKQNELGVLAGEIICKEGLELIFKANNGSPACVRPEIKKSLVERGWAK